MGSYVESACRHFTAGGAIGIFLRAKLTAGTLALAGIGDKEIGCMERPAFAAGDIVSVRLRTAQGTCKMVASKAIAIGADVFTAANGQVSDVQGTGAFYEGTSMEAAAAAGDAIEILRANAGDTAGA